MENLELIIEQLKAEKEKHLKNAKNCDKSIREIRAKIEKQNAIDRVKRIGAYKKPIPTFYCAKERGIQRVAKCSNQCALCQAVITVGIH